MTHLELNLKALYFGTPVVIVSSLNPDGSTNIAPISSAWWLGSDAMIGTARSSQTTANLLRTPECVLNLAQASLAPYVDKLALMTGTATMSEHKREKRYTFEPRKFEAAGLTAAASTMGGPARVAEADIQLEGRVVASHPFENPGASAVAFQVRVERVHVEEGLVLPDGRHIDTVAWDPLIMKFCDFFGRASNLRSSRLAHAWAMPDLQHVSAEACDDGAE
jgi:flavin reductase (DIM6/NTAB) family NADH-FMN oxidoreductase RutF